MLYDKRWDKPQADVFSLDSLIAWLEKQPADHTYCYLENGSCLIAKYIKAHNIADADLFVGATFIRNAGVRRDMPKWWDSVARAGGMYDHKNHTFGAALDRAREIHRWHHETA